jgi:hypothetical protein
MSRKPLDIKIRVERQEKKILRLTKEIEEAKDEYQKLLEEQKRRFRAVAELQLDTWKRADGWIYWNWQLEKDGHLPPEEYWKESWDFRRCLENGWMTEEMLLT